MSDTPTPAYGEPWKPLQPDVIYDNFGYWVADAFNPLIRDRIITCVNACAGMADPAKEIANLKMELDASCNAEHLRQVRDENKVMRDQLYRICKEGFGNQDTIGGEAADDYIVRQLSAMREAIREAHKIIQVLYMDALDHHKESWPRANEWMEKYAAFAKP
jgi:hypothetical protein